MNHRPGAHAPVQYELRIEGHLDEHWSAWFGGLVLTREGDGTTTLIGRTWYNLHVRPAWYFDWWTHEIFRSVHLRVMNNVKRLAETEP